MKRGLIRRIWDVTLTVRDLKRAVEFYENVLGLQKKYEFRDYAGFDCGGVEIGLKTWGELENPRKGEPCINFQVDDVDAAYETLKRKGVRDNRRSQRHAMGRTHHRVRGPGREHSTDDGDRMGEVLQSMCPKMMGWERVP